MLLDKIYQDLKQNGFDGVLISRTDSFLGEHYPKESERLKELSGFTGSAGMAFVSFDKKVLFVDSRYTEQAKVQTDFEVFEVPRETRLTLWLNENMPHKRIAFDGWTHSVMTIETLRLALKEKEIEIDELPQSCLKSWFQTKAFFQDDVFDYDIKYCGKTSQEKLKQVQDYLLKNDLDFYLINAPENVSWLLNKRAKTVGEYPVVFERGFVDRLGNYFSFSENELLLKNKKVGVELAQTPYALMKQLASYQCEIKDLPDIISQLKAQKNSVEIQNIKQACLSESKTICRFLAWLEKEKSHINEYDCDIKLKSLRSEDSLYLADSFDTIAASGDHAVRAHYMAQKQTAYQLKDYPLLMIDTGGHYLNGTTDMTRTICISQPTDLMKKRYTQVLKGHIALASCHLTDTTSTAPLDLKAHQFLRQDGVDYYHATSHGIGMMLAVHEMPPIVYEKDKQGMKAGMVFSNEPAYYDKENGFGIRLENMLLSCQDNQQGLVFENLLFIPFDYRLVDFNLLTQEEKKWLLDYHLTIQQKIMPLLEGETKQIISLMIEPFIK